MRHEVFISYRHREKEVAEQLRTILEANNIRCWFDASGIHASEQWDDQIARAITESRLLLLLITAGTIESPKQQKREVSVADKYDVPVLPLYVAPPGDCRAFDYVLGNTQHIDASQAQLSILERLEAAVREVRRLLNELELVRLKARETRKPEPQQTAAPPVAPVPPPPNGQPVRRLSVALLYKRDVPEDERLLDLLNQRLTARGHTVFVDRQLDVGAEWRRVIREKVENADAVVPLLSLFSVGSEMLEEEVKIAARHQQTNSGKPRILPVRVNYEGALPPGLGHHLQRLQYVLWRTPADDDAVVEALTASLETPQPRPATVLGQIEMPVGAVSLTSPFYIVRDEDRTFQSGVERRERIVLVKGARQMGKTSLIARGLQSARKKDCRVAVTDFQTLNESDFRDLRSFYLALADHLAEQLNIDASIEETWKDRRGPNRNFEHFIENQLLRAAETPLVWALDEVDRLFACPFGTEVFGLFRSWHNAGPLQDASSAWTRMTLVIGFATEASLFIRDVNMSPFNVGVRVALADFTAEQVAELNARYGSPLSTDADIARLMERVGGQPFLVRRSFYAIAVEGMPFERLLTEAATDHGVFGDHLRRFYISLHRDTELEMAMRRFVVEGRELTTEQFYRLRSAGLVVGEARQDAGVRCGIYHDYLKRHLD